MPAEPKLFPSAPEDKNVSSAYDTAQWLKTADDRQREALIDGIPDEALRHHVRHAVSAPKKYIKSVSCAQYLLHFPELFKPDLAHIAEGKYSKDAVLFEGNEGIYHYFKRNVLDVIDYQQGPRRAPVGVCKEKGEVREKPLPGDMFSHGTIVTDIPVTGANAQEQRKHAEGFIHAIERIMKPCSVKFTVVEENDRTFVRTDMNEPTFSTLGSIVANAAYLELTEDELVKQWREGQKRLWENWKARDIGRLALPGVAELAVIGLPGRSFRQEMYMYDTSKTLEFSRIDKAYMKAAEHPASAAFPEPDLFRRGKEMVMEVTPVPLGDGRIAYTIDPKGHITKALSKEWKNLSAESALSKLTSATKLAAHAAVVGGKIVMAGYRPGKLERDSWQVFETELTAMRRERASTAAHAATEAAEKAQTENATEWMRKIAEDRALHAEDSSVGRDY